MQFGTSRLSLFVSALVLMAPLTLISCASQKSSIQNTPAETQNAEATALKPKDITFDENLIDRALLFGDADKTQVRLSPNGKKLSWLAAQDGVLNVFVADLKTPEKAEAITQESERGVARYFWAPDSKAVLFQKDVGGDENWQLFSVDLKKKKVKTLAEGEGIRTDVVAISSKKKREIVVRSNKRDPKVFDLYTLKLKSGKMKLLEKNTGFLDYYIDSSLKPRLATRMNEKGELELHKKKGRKWVSFYTLAADDQMGFAVHGFDSRGTRAYVTDSSQGDKAALYEMSLKSGTLKPIASDDKADITRVLIHPKKHTLQAARATYLRDRWQGIGKGFAEHLENLSFFGEGEIDIVSRSSDDKTWIVSMSYDNAPLEYLVYLPKSGEGKPLFSSRPALVGKPLVKMNPVVIKARDGLELVSYLSLPKDQDADSDGKADAKGPMVLWVHGGPWSRDRFHFSSVHQWLANRGYAVLSVNFRGSVGFGKNFVNAGNLEWGGKMHDDLVDAVKWAVDQGIADASQVAIAGGSYGGYATLAGLTFTPDTFACGVDIVGPSNLTTLLETIPPYWSQMVEMFAKRIGDSRTEEGRALLSERSPLNKVEQITKPLLIGQGKNDPRVKQSESDQIVNAMGERKIPVTYVLYPDEGHGFRNAQNRLSFFALSEVFLAQCLGGKAAPYAAEQYATTSMTVPTGSEFVYALNDTLALLNKDAGSEKVAEEKVAEEKAAEESPKVAKAPVFNEKGMNVGDRIKDFKLPVLNAADAGMKKWAPADYKKGGEKAKKATVMSFFATWCGPCKEEMPELVKLHEKYKDKGLGVALVSIDDSDKRDEIVELVKEKGVTFPVVFDRFKVVGRRYEAERLPYLIIFDEEGVVKVVHIGYTEEVQAGLEGEIKSALGL